MSTKIHLSPSELWILIGKQFVTFVGQHPELAKKVLGCKKENLKNWLKCDFSCSTSSSHKLAEKNILFLLEPTRSTDSIPSSPMKGRLNFTTFDPQMIFTEGTSDDWKLLSRKVGKILVHSHGNSSLIKWYTCLSRTIKGICDFHSSGVYKPDFWQNMFKVSTNPSTWELELFGWGTLFTTIEPKKVPVVKLDDCELNLDCNPWKELQSPIEAAFQREISASLKSKGRKVDFSQENSGLKQSDPDDDEFCIV